MDDIREERPASESERDTDAAASGPAADLPRHRRIGPESEVRGGPEASEQEEDQPDKTNLAQGPAIHAT